MGLAEQATYVTDGHLGGCGVCQCGCGKPTPVAKVTKSSRGHVKGLPLPFLNGHYANRRCDPSARLLARRQIDQNECWLWMGTRLPRGYGTIGWGDRGRKIGVHRLAAHLWLGFDLKSGMQVLHRCDNPPCFNPDHLFVGTPADNIADMDAKGRRATIIFPGDRNPAARLSKSEVEALREAFRSGETRAELARLFGISWSQTARICSGESRSHG